MVTVWVRNDDVVDPPNPLSVQSRQGAKRPAESVGPLAEVHYEDPSIWRRHRRSVSVLDIPEDERAHRIVMSVSTTPGTEGCLGAVVAHGRFRESLASEVPGCSVMVFT